MELTSLPAGLSLEASAPVMNRAPRASADDAQDQRV